MQNTTCRREDTTAIDKNEICQDDWNAMTVYLCTAVFIIICVEQTHTPPKHTLKLTSTWPREVPLERSLGANTTAEFP
jgi:hypothetical protein